MYSNAHFLPKDQLSRKCHGNHGTSKKTCKQKVNAEEKFTLVFRGRLEMALRADSMGQSSFLQSAMGESQGR
jgi:hypothetical protein